MDTEALGKSRSGRFFMRLMASIMESRLRYRLFGPEKILAAAGIKEGANVLEVGCGTGFFTIPASRMIGERGSLTSLDTSPLAVEMVSQKVEQANVKNVRVVKGNVLDTGLAGASLDEVFIFGVIPAPGLPMDRLLVEMRRILKQGGILAIWPPSWVLRTIARSGAFEFVNKRHGVYTYRRTVLE